VARQSTLSGPSLTRIRCHEAVVQLLGSFLIQTAVAQRRDTGVVENCTVLLQLLNPRGVQSGPKNEFVGSFGP
jgi:hypothetical protein